jgi:hypothetical protein
MIVQAYWNLHKKCFSIRYKGKVIGYSNRVHLTNCKFKVSEAGRQRVLREKRKNVHAVVEGELMPDNEPFYGAIGQIYYNPYKYETFEDEFHEPVFQSSNVLLTRSDRGPVILG